MRWALGKFFLFSLVAIACFSTTTSTHAQAAPNLLNIQGRLTTDAGDPITAPTNVEFRIFDADTGGSMLWAETHSELDPDDNGVFSALLGSLVALPDGIFSSSNRWLEIEVNGTTQTPRQRIVSAPYAVQAQEASEVTGTANLEQSDPIAVFSTTSPTFQNVPGLALTITTTGRPVLLTLKSINSSSSNLTSNGTSALRLQIRRNADTTVLDTSFRSFDGFQLALPASVVNVIDMPPAGTHDYTVRILSEDGDSVQVDDGIFLVALEIR